MANTINDLYLKYVNKVGRTLEQDRYFQYLFEMVQAGNNTLQNKYQILHKVVDERWLTTIEESLDAINTIIDKPRRFIVTNEELVPVALAKKISADSVRHLSMNTQFIASSEDGDIQPTRVLNVSTEESYDLYENRFIYHLIQRLMTFIDKRTDVIFWATGDETRNKLIYESKVDDAYEQIEYKIEMTIKNVQSFAENDTDNMSVFMRIDRVRRMVLSLRNSSFCSIMAGCAKVRSPIQRTNLMMKDPNYRTCYKLWQFLENYDDVGYTIDVQDSAVEFDEEYLFQMYTNLITNYTVFKSLLEDQRNLNEVANVKRRKIKPKFIKKIEEQIVEDRDLPDVEIRQVFIDEVTQAQLDAEAKLEEETKAREEAQRTLEEMDDQMISLQQQVSNLMMMNQEAEIRAEDERVAKEEALGQIQEAKDAAEAAKAQAESEIAQVKAQSESDLATAKAQAESDVAAAKAQAESDVAEAKAQAESEIAAVKEQSHSEIEEIKAAAQNEVRETKEQADLLIEERSKAAKEEIAQIRSQAKDQIDATIRESKQKQKESAAREKDAMGRAEYAEGVAAKLRLEKDNTIADLEQLRQAKEAQVEKLQMEKQELNEQFLSTKSSMEQEIAQMIQAKKQLEEEYERLKLQMEQELLDLQKQKDRMEQKLTGEKEVLNKRIEIAHQTQDELTEKLEESKKETEQARLEAQLAKEKAEANTLSHFIISAWNDRKKKGSDISSEDNEEK